MIELLELDKRIGYVEKGIIIYPDFMTIDVEIDIDDANKLPVGIDINLINSNKDETKLDRFRLTNRMTIREDKSCYYIRVTNEAIDSILSFINIPKPIIINFILGIVSNDEDMCRNLVGQLEADKILDDNGVNILSLHKVINSVKYFACGLLYNSHIKNEEPVGLFKIVTGVDVSLTALLIMCVSSSAEGGNDLYKTYDIMKNSVTTDFKINSVETLIELFVSIINSASLANSNKLVINILTLELCLCLLKDSVSIEEYGNESLRFLSSITSNLIPNLNSFNNLHSFNNTLLISATYSLGRLEHFDGHKFYINYLLLFFKNKQYELINDEILMEGFYKDVQIIFKDIKLNIFTYDLISTYVLNLVEYDLGTNSNNVKLEAILYYIMVNNVEVGVKIINKYLKHLKNASLDSSILFQRKAIEFIESNTNE